MFKQREKCKCGKPLKAGTEAELNMMCTKCYGKHLRSTPYYQSVLQKFNGFPSCQKFIKANPDIF